MHGEIIIPDLREFLFHRWSHHQLEFSANFVAIFDTIFGSKETDERRKNENELESDILLLPD